MAHLGEQTVWRLLRGINFSGQHLHFFGFGGFGLIAFAIIFSYHVERRIGKHPKIDALRAAINFRCVQ